MTQATTTPFDKMFMTGVPDAKKVEHTISQLDEIIKSARECLNHASFTKYREIYEKEEKQIVDVIISYTNAFILDNNANPTMYAMRMAMLVQKIYDLRRLLRNVEVDASKKIGEDNVKQTQ